MATPLEMWTIYENPTDYPGMFVARRWEIAGGDLVPTTEVHAAETLAACRTVIPPGLCRINRLPADDPAIVEVWL